jgi:tetratricopeptide (TPR) repeat protein
MNGEDKNSHRFDNLVTVLIASTAVWVAITAFLQNVASNTSDQARRRAQQHVIEATKLEINGSIRASYEYQGAYQAWYELDLEAINAEQNEDPDAVEQYRELQRRIMSLSALLGPEYFKDPEGGFPEFARYEAETYLVEATLLSETYLAEAELGNATDNVADALIVQITLLTVTLSLYGLSLALKGRMRWLFVTVGSGIVVFCMLWLGLSALELLVAPEVNQQSIAAYAEGIGLAHQGRRDEALENFTLAIRENPGYAKAYYQRALVYYDKGDLESAIAEMEAARARGLDDTTLNWNLGWLYYLTGQYANAIEANNRILDRDPTVIGVRANQALNYLAMGDMASSREQYDLLIREAERQVHETQPSASLWYYMDAAALDLQNLLDELDGSPRAWGEAPAAASISGDPEAVRTFALEQMRRIKEAVVALEYTGQLPQTGGVMEVQSFAVGLAEGFDDNGQIVGFKPANNATIPSGEDSFYVEFTHQGPPPKQLIWKIYFNGYEAHSLRTVSNRDIGESGISYWAFGYKDINVFILAKGEYTVELYADNILVLRTTFYVR